MNNWRTVILEWLNVNAMQFSWLEQLIVASVILFVIVLVDRLCKMILHRFVFRLIKATKATWDDVLFDHKVLDKAVALIPAILLVVFLPFVFVGSSVLYGFVQRLCWVYLVGAFAALIVTALTALSHILLEKESFRDKPVKGFVQMIQVIFVALAVIVMVSIIIDKSPTYLLTGIGASAAVLMLVFQDSILGLVAGIQLSANKMMQVGDWVVVKDKGIDGTVLEITLTTVKIRNWDYTISTIQPQALVSGSFVNWSNMFRSGGRRIARTINIDVHSVHFMTEEEIEPWRKDILVAPYITQMNAKIAAARQTGDEFTARSLQITNLGLFREYLQQYILSMSTSNRDFISMVRLMEPTQYGVPMQIYFFTARTAWVEYEAIQSAFFEHVFSIIPQFGLRMFQSPSGDDLRLLGERVQD